MASLGETKECENGVFVAAVRDVAGVEAVELRGDVGLGDHGLHVVHRYGGLRDVYDAGEERHRVEGGRRRVARGP